MGRETYRDVRNLTVTVAAGASIHDDEDNLEVSFHQISVEAHYWAEPTEPEHGLNRPDYDDEINVFPRGDDALLISENGLSAIKQQCLELFRGELIKAYGLNLTFGKG